MGAGDQVPQTLEQIGMFVTPLQPEDLATENLGKYHCIIAGIRAYQVRSDLVEQNIRLLKYVENGGVFIVQYNTPLTWNRTQYGPYQSRIVDRKHRVTDENSPMTILMPEHRIFHYGYKNEGSILFRTGISSLKHYLPRMIPENHLLMEDY